MPQQFSVDDDLVALVWKLAQPKPFETLSFSAALRRVLKDEVGVAVNENSQVDLDDLYAEALAARSAGKKAATPSPEKWVATVPDLRGKKGLNTWKAICNALGIDTAGDSARRKLQNWVRANRPTWPAVPDIEIDANLRPTSGKALFAFTDQWLKEAGLFDGGGIEKQEAIRIAGQSAVAYHLREKNFAEESGEIHLTPKGQAHFLARRSRL